MRDKSQLIDAPERRGIAVSDFELRKNAADDTLSFRGYATVFDAPYDLYGGPAQGGWTETVDKRAFDVTLAAKPDLHLLINHEGMPLARTKSGTMSLAADKHGLLVDVPSLDRRDPDVQRLEVKMERGDMDEMSFAFRVKAQEWSDDDTKRHLTEVSLHKGDVSVVNFGANPATSAHLRGLLAKLNELGAEDALVEARAIGEDDIRAAHNLLGQLLHSLKPSEYRGMSLVEARKLLELDA